jgi:glycosyltransferase involved in cell wall biosynthesis
MPRKLHFVIACEVIDNMRLMQPHGMIPYTLHKYFNYDSEVLTYKHGHYPYLKNELKGLKIRFLHSLYSKKAKLPFFLYLALNAKKIDVLMVYNIKKRPIYNGLIYKLFNPKGFLYAKADTSQARFGFYVDNAFFVYKFYMRALGRLFLTKCDAISVETTYVRDSNTQVDKDKLLLMPCGFDPVIAENLGVPVRPFEEKSNIVLHVARMGIPQKNSEHLLNSIAKIDIPGDWKFVFIGSQTESFRKVKDAFFRDKPDKAEHIEFHEHISDKSKLYDYYSLAKIFCLPSRRETFGNVLVEAQYFGNAIVGSEHIPSVRDLTDHGKAGCTFSLEKENDLAEILDRLMNNQELLEKMSCSAREYAMNNLIWKDIVAPLDRKIMAHYQESTTDN